MQLLKNYECLLLFKKVLTINLLMKLLTSQKESLRIKNFKENKRQTYIHHVHLHKLHVRSLFLMFGHHLLYNCVTDVNVNNVTITDVVQIGAEL